MFVIFKKNNPDEKLLRNSERNEEIITGIFDDDIEDDDDQIDQIDRDDQNTRNAELIVSRIKDIELTKNKSKISFATKKNRENRESHVTPTNQRDEKTEKRVISDQSTRRSTRLIKLYNRYEYDNQKRLIALSAPDFETKFGPSTYQKTIDSTNQRLWKNAIIE